MEDVTKREIAELKKKLSDALTQIERLTESVDKQDSPEEEPEWVKGLGKVGVGNIEEDESDVVVSIYIVDGVDFDKVEAEGVDLDDEGSYIEVYPKNGDLVGRGLTAEGVLLQMGIEVGSPTAIKFKSLPEEYYLTPEEGGVPYNHFPTSERIHLTNQTQKTHLEKVIERIEQEYGETSNKEYLPVTEGYLDCGKIEEVSDVLEEFREIGDISLLHTLDKEKVEPIFQQGLTVRSLLRGYYVKSQKDTGVNITTVSFVLAVEGTPGAWLFNFNGLYPVTGHEEVYALMETEHPDLCEFMLDSALHVTEEELHQYIMETTK